MEKEETDSFFHSYARSKNRVWGEPIRNAGDSLCMAQFN